ncbi:rRNA maturation RNase YbeY [Sporohalobacter salinus]|uniref:rRNA maturation RNase YbeY n=1 Tax=Sporohalobacter salinus TaxID=1494606 RepID=UPI00195F9916|nr:rRNA maturation RNase YbeY [Sporohalobacter salinus]MBM7623159.1 putative rRNA maturation factor [Sporohalobacter salinus]
MEIQINNLQEKIDVNNGVIDLVNEVVKEVESSEGVKAREVSIALVDNEYIKELNAKYRELDEPTDVLSFPLNGEMLGDIIISLERAKSQANNYNHSLDREVGFLIVHGMLHLLGYDHKEEEAKKEMRKKEEEVLNKLDLER